MNAKSQFLQQVEKPPHGSDCFNAHQHGRKSGMKIADCGASMQQRSTHNFSALRIEHRQRLLASVQITSYNSHSASFVPSSVG